VVFGGALRADWPVVFAAAALRADWPVVFAAAALRADWPTAAGRSERGQA
jgi:hypothetical protein